LIVIQAPRGYSSRVGRHHDIPKPKVRPEPKPMPLYHERSSFKVVDVGREIVGTFNCRVRDAMVAPEVVKADAKTLGDGCYVPGPITTGPVVDSYGRRSYSRLK